KGADVNARTNHNNDTPLHLAAEKGHKDIVELLIAKGADVHSRNHERDTPLHLADDLDVVELLIAKGADVNAKNNGDMTPAQARAQRERARRENHHTDF
ncbi:MAG: ankyrin repeat domain-containing protein, partial [Nostoc sp.]